MRLSSLLTLALIGSAHPVGAFVVSWEKAEDHPGGMYQMQWCYHSPIDSELQAFLTEMASESRTAFPPDYDPNYRCFDYTQQTPPAYIPNNIFPAGWVLRVRSVQQCDYVSEWSEYSEPISPRDDEIPDNPLPVPEPGLLLLMVAGCVGLAILYRIRS